MDEALRKQISTMLNKPKGTITQNKIPILLQAIDAALNASTLTENERKFLKKAKEHLIARAKEPQTYIRYPKLREELKKVLLRDTNTSPDPSTETQTKDPVAKRTPENPKATMDNALRNQVSTILIDKGKITPKKIPPLLEAIDAALNASTLTENERKFLKKAKEHLTDRLHGRSKKPVRKEMRERLKNVLLPNNTSPDSASTATRNSTLTDTDKDKKFLAKVSEISRTNTSASASTETKDPVTKRAPGKSNQLISSSTKTSNKDVPFDCRPPGLNCIFLNAGGRGTDGNALLLEICKILFGSPSVKGTGHKAWRLPQSHVDKLKSADVICICESSKVFVKNLVQRLGSNWSYLVNTEPGKSNGCISILYKADIIERVEDFNMFDCFEKLKDADTEFFPTEDGYGSRQLVSLFRHKGSQQIFAVSSIHGRHIGLSDKRKEATLRDIFNKTKQCLAEFDCPVIFGGDMNVKFSQFFELVGGKQWPSDLTPCGDDPDSKIWACVSNSVTTSSVKSTELDLPDDIRKLVENEARRIALKYDEDMADKFVAIVKAHFGSDHKLFEMLLQLEAQPNGAAKSADGFEPDEDA